MDYIWSPWRYRYIASAGKPQTCIFCAKSKETDDVSNLIVYRGKYNFVILNLYPYTSGHLMVAPYEHIATLDGASEDSSAEMMKLVRLAEGHIRAVYSPDGLNIGMNIGRSAGAGVADHIHMHVLPRWNGDSNFMTTVGETRVLPEDLAVTYERLRKAFTGS